MSTAAALTVFTDPEGAAQAVAETFIETLSDALAHQDYAHVVLTGGSMGIRSLEAIAAHPRLLDLDWSRVHIWWGDERWVPAESEDRNDKQADDALLSRLPLNPDKIHRMPAAGAGIDLDQAALSYADELYRVHGGTARRTPEFDILLLGVGPDGHIASLFPGHAQVYDKAEGAVPVYDSPKPPAERISLTLPTINRAKHVWFVAAGPDKATAVHLALRGLWFVDLPASGAKGTLSTRWFVDELAAAELDDDLRAEYEENA